MEEAKDIEIPLPEAMIHHIQSFMTGKEAARTTLISKSWRNAWLTRPSLDIDDRDFSYHRFVEFATKTMQRYQDLSLKIQSSRLRCCRWDVCSITRYFILNTMKIGATNVELELELDLDSYPRLPQEVLACKNLVRLSLSRCSFDRKYVIRCSNLKSLTLYNVEFTRYGVFKDMLECCSSSIEELSLSHWDNSTSRRLELNGMHKYGLQMHKLKRLFLFSINVDDTFFTDFASRFPCLKDLSIHFCTGFSEVKIASTSLETVSFKRLVGLTTRYKDRFNVPNIRKFTFYSSGFDLPYLSIKGGCREWELDITICWNGSPIFPFDSWFLKLKKLLTKFRRSKISLSIELKCFEDEDEHEVSFKVLPKPLPKPLVLENLRIDGPSSHCCNLLVRLFGICRPKFITHDSLTAKRKPWSFKNPFLVVLCKKLMHRGITPNGGIPDQKMFGMFGLKKVNVEVYKRLDKKWEPLVQEEHLGTSEDEPKIRFQLVWE